MRYNEKGEEILDDTPVSMPLDFKRPPTIEERIMMAVRTVVSQQAVEQGQESFEEANDFGDEEDDIDDLPLTPYEQQPIIDEDVVAAVKRDRQRRKDASAKDSARVEGVGRTGEKVSAGSGAVGSAAARDSGAQGGVASAPAAEAGGKS